MNKNSLVGVSYEYYGRRDLIQKYNCNELKKVISITNVEVGVMLNKVSLGNLNQISITMNYLYKLLGIVPKVYDLGVADSARGVDPEHRVKCSVKLSGERKYWFLDYLIYVAIPINEKRYGKYSRYTNGRYHYTLEFEDLNVFYNLKDEYGFDNKIYVTIYFDGDAKMSNTLLDILGIKLA